MGAEPKWQLGAEPPIEPPLGPRVPKRPLGWVWLGLGLLALLGWDLSGLDLWLTRAVGSAQGFAWRDAWLLSGLLHVGGRHLALALLLLLIWDAWRPLLPGPRRSRRLYWLGVVLLTALLVPGLKLASLSSCPWDLKEFGGTAFYRSHWQLTLADGGPGRCFPSGHAVSAFAFWGLYFLWRDTRAQLAQVLLWTLLCAGALFTVTQVLRGAHFFSHGLWSAWLCAALAYTAQAVLDRSGAWRRARCGPVAAACAAHEPADHGPLRQPS